MPQNGRECEICQALAGMKAWAGAASQAGISAHAAAYPKRAGCHCLQMVMGGLAWLTIGIPTFPRKDDADYLTRTLETLLEELPADDTDPLYARVRVLVMNNSPGNHSVFSQARLPGLGAAHAARTPCTGRLMSVLPKKMLLVTDRHPCGCYGPDLTSLRPVIDSVIRQPPATQALLKPAEAACAGAAEGGG